MTTTPDDVQLVRMLDNVRVETFKDDNAAFLVSIMCSMEFEWRDEDKEGFVCTNGKYISWKRSDFLRCDFEERKYTLIHEIWHPARLHLVRGIGKDPDLWNYVCDIVINNAMIRGGRKLPNNGYWVFNLDLDENGTLCEEQLYEKLTAQQFQPPPREGDMTIELMDSAQQAQMIHEQVAIVIRAQQAAISAGKPGTVPGSVVDELNKFLNPVVPWVEALHEWMNNLVVCDYSWSQRSRRFPAIYMPSMTTQPEGLEDFVAFVDVSGSVTDEMEVRINSELKYIFEELKPEKLTVVQFDVEIQDVRVFDEANGFEGIKVYGRGGTDLQCVHDWIEEHRPTAIMVLSDLECDPMPEPTFNVPVLWCVLGDSLGYQHTPTYGRIIYIKE